MAVLSNDLGKEARSIAQSKSAKQAWTDLKAWAANSGPTAMKTALIEFMNVHGGSPEAAVLMPELLKSAFFAVSPVERKSLLPPLEKAKPQSMTILRPRPLMPTELNRPTLSINFQPRGNDAPRLAMLEPLTPIRDPAYLRDTPIRMRDRLPNLGQPVFASTQNANRFDPSKSPGTFSSSKGEHLVKSLVDTMRSHGTPYLAPKRAKAPVAKKKTAMKKAPKRKKAKRKK